VRYSGKVTAGWPLATIFCNGAGAGQELEERLARALDRARAAWPGVAVDDATFVRYLAERVPPDRLDAVFAEDLYLACACAAGDAAAMDAFDRRHFGPLAAALERGGVEAAVADEVVQRLRAQLFVRGDGKYAKIGQYSGRAPIGGWLYVAAVRLATRSRRDETTRAMAARNAAAAAGLPSVDPELATIQRRYGEVSRRAFHEAFACLNAEERSVLRLHFVDGLNIERIGAVLGLSRATVGRRMIAARKRLLQETLRLLGERLEATPTEVRSLLGVLRSHLEVSFGALLGEKHAG
jgi:RNA polymerase sigma-70 factor (ECF subfamily)